MPWQAELKRRAIKPAFDTAIWPKNFSEISHLKKVVEFFFFGKTERRIFSAADRFLHLRRTSIRIGGKTGITAVWVRRCSRMLA